MSLPLCHFHLPNEANKIYTLTRFLPAKQFALQSFYSLIDFNEEIENFHCCGLDIPGHVKIIDIRRHMFNPMLAVNAQKASNIIHFDNFDHITNQDFSFRDASHTV